ncbi:hypothetical protein [Photobacterium indicum]|uniref:hypothetical protein n=1 Tax=Photobacterium indicum TaxID=81447 RepID=UPI003D0BA5F1
MSRDTRRTRKNQDGSFIKVPAFMFDSAAYTALSSNARDVLMQLLRQYRGGNNGNLTAIWGDHENLVSIKSEKTFKNAVSELLNEEFIEITGTGTTSKKGKPPYLYAITWLEVDPPMGNSNRIIKSSPARKPQREWQRCEHRNEFERVVVRGGKRE